MGSSSRSRLRATGHLEGPYDFGELVRLCQGQDPDQGSDQGQGDEDGAPATAM
jgi:hypothetical protein